MELRHLRYFVAVAEAENVTRAAAKLHVSQPAISRQVHDLEEELGLALLVRTAKTVRLTAAGRIFLEEARAVLARAEAAVATVRAAADDAHGELAVGYAPSPTVQILPRALRQFQAEFPGIRVTLHDLSSEELLAGVREGRLQLALVVQPARTALRGLRFQALARFAWGVAMPPQHVLAGRASLSTEEIATEPLITYGRGSYPEYHRTLSRHFATSGRVPRIAEEHESVTSLIAAIEAGRGIAIVTSSLACMVGPRLKIIPLKSAEPQIVVGAVSFQGTASLAVERFIAAAAEPAESVVDKGRKPEARDAAQVGRRRELR